MITWKFPNFSINTIWNIIVLKISAQISELRLEICYLNLPWKFVKSKFRDILRTRINFLVSYCNLESGNGILYRWLLWYIKKFGFCSWILQPRSKMIYIQRKSLLFISDFYQSNPLIQSCLRSTFHFWVKRKKKGKLFSIRRLFCVLLFTLKPLVWWNSSINIIIDSCYLSHKSSAAVCLCFRWNMKIDLNVNTKSTKKQRFDVADGSFIILLDVKP